MKEQLILGRKTVSNFLVPFPSIVTTIDRSGKPNALTMSYLTAIHWDPPSVLLSISSTHKSNRNLKENPKFTINVLENDTRSIEIAQFVGTKSGNEKVDITKESYREKLIDPKSQEWPPIINGTVIALHGIIVQESEYHGQVLYIGEIKEAKILESLHTIDLTQKNLMWKALDEIVMSHSDIYSNV